MVPLGIADKPTLKAPAVFNEAGINVAVIHDLSVQISSPVAKAFAQWRSSLPQSLPSRQCSGTDW